jgi:hypothetical protein
VDGLFNVRANTISFISSLPAYIEGANTFSNFVCTAQGKALSFEADAIQTIEGNFTVAGSVNAPVSLFSFVTSAEWLVDPQGPRGRCGRSTARPGKKE